MVEIILSAFLLGISTGVSCIAICAPFFLPYLIAKDRRLRDHFFEFFQFLLGRLVGYLAFGIIFAYLGKGLNVGWVNTLSNFSLGLLAAFMIIYGLNFLNIHKLEKITCYFKFKKIKLPFLIGLFTGVNICPPFLLSLNYVFILGSVFKGMVYFFFFFLATNLYFIPVVFLGKLSYFKEFQTFARITILLVGLLFFAYSIYNLISNQNLIQNVLFN